MILNLISKRFLKNHLVIFLKVILALQILADIKIYQKKIRKLQKKDLNNYCRLFLQITIHLENKILNLKKMRMKIPIYSKKKPFKWKKKKFKFQILTATWNSKILRISWIFFYWLEKFQIILCIWLSCFSLAQF